jgi:hypothetical protein
MPDDFVDLLKAYKQKHGHCDVPIGYRDDNGYALGRRCNQERRASREPGYPKARRSELSALGFRFDVRVLDPTGEILLQRVAQFKAERGHCKIGRKYVCDDGFTLGSRVSYYMRRADKSGRNVMRDELLRLGVQRQAPALKSDYYADPDQQKPVLDAVKAFKKEHGHVDIASRYIDPNGLNLGTRLTDARVHHKAGRLSPVFREALEQLGVSLASRDLVMPLNDFVVLLKAYKQKHGDCDVPHAYRDENGYALGNRCYVERRKARKPDYPQERRSELSEMGFSFDVTVIDPEGEVLLQRVVQFKAEHGHCSIPSSYVCDDGFTLGNRVRNLMRKAEHSGRQALRNQLIELGVPPMKAHKRAAEEIVRAVIDYKQAHGSKKIELRYRSPGGIALGMWLYRERVRALKGEEDRELRRRLEALGVSYDIVNPDGSVRKA